MVGSDAISRLKKATMLGTFVQTYTRQSLTAGSPENDDLQVRNLLFPDVQVPAGKLLGMLRDPHGR